jgi:plastocyanin
MRRELRDIVCTACVVGAAVAVSACGKERGRETASSAGTETPTAVPGASTASGEAATPKGGGTISGTITFAGTPPANPTIDMSEEADCASQYSGSPVDSQVVVAGGKLANVFVYVKSGLPANAKYAAPAKPAVIDQKGCLYHPRVFGVVEGQQIEILNSDPVLHNIKAVPKVNRGFNVSQPSKGMHTNRTFSKEEVMVPIECNVHGWMHASIGVLPHPFFASSGPDGTFTIEGLPAGSYVIEAVHPKLGTKTMNVTVPANGKATADFKFGGATT